MIIVEKSDNFFMTTESVCIIQALLSSTCVHFSFTLESTYKNERSEIKDDVRSKEGRNITLRPNVKLMNLPRNMIYGSGK